MKKDAILLILSLLIFTIPVFGQNLLWEIKSSETNLPSSYLFGSIHIQDEAVFSFDSTIYDLIDSCDYFAAEIDLSNTQADQMMPYLISQHSISSYLSTDELDKLEKIGAEQQLSIAQMEWIKPIYLIQLLQSFSDHNKSKEALDLHLTHYALSLNKIISGLESFQDQASLLDSLNKQYGIAMLQEYLSQTDDKKAYQQIIQHYLNQDINLLYTLSKKDLPQEFQPLFLEHRNIQMVKTMNELMKKHSTFFVVGAAHLAGPEGILQLLQNKGYEIKPLKITFKAKNQ